jgi:hypothetical protein
VSPRAKSYGATTPMPVCSRGGWGMRSVCGSGPSRAKGLLTILRGVSRVRLQETTVLCHWSL